MRRAELSDFQDEKTDQIRRLLRYIQETVRKLDDVAHRAIQPVELFSPQVVAWRYRLREMCEKLMFLESKTHSRKAEDTLWRKGFYDAFNACKQMKKGELWNEIEQTMLERHFLSGIGTYQHLTHRLQHDCRLDFSSIVDCSYLQQDVGLRKVKKVLSCKSIDVMENTWAQDCLQRCLIYMGDLTRYRRDLKPGIIDSKDVARRYYQQAININPDVGMPHNQLGTVAGEGNYGVDTVYHYMRCLMCPQSFDGAESNLRRALERNRKLYEERRRKQVTDTYPQLVASFLMVVEVFFFEDDTPYSGPEMCQQTLLDLGRCTDNPEKPEIALRLLAIMLLSIYRLQQTGSSQVSIAIAFTLALLSHLVYQTAAGLHAVLRHFGLEGGIEEQVKNGHVDERKRKRMNRLLRLRRRKRIDSESDSSDGSDLSSDNDCESNDGSDSDEKSSLESEDDEALTVDTNKNITKQNGCIKPTRTTDQLNIIAQDPLLPTIKIACDFLTTNEELIQTPSARPLWSHMVHLINVLNIDTTTVTKDGMHPEVDKALNLGPKEFKQSIPMSEDIELRCLPPLKLAQSKLLWNDHYRFSKRDETLMRILSIRRFGHFLTTIKQSSVTYDKNTRKFSQTPPTNGVIKKADDGEDKEEVMQQMAALWLREEVKDLEDGGNNTSIKANNKQGMPQLSPYLVPDTSALMQHLPFVKQLLESRNFILIVPAIVVSELDDGKKTIPGAREAIRWLEGQFRRGLRYIRAQRTRERAVLPALRYPKRKDKKECKFFSLLECCHYLSQRSSGQGMVTLLTGDKNQAEHSTLANTSGIEFEHIEVFHSKWKTSSKSRG